MTAQNLPEPVDTLWGKIIRNSNWERYWDELNGKPLTQGERLEVEFPDGSSVYNLEVINKITTENVMDLGHDTTVGNSRSVWVTKFKGVEVHIPLVGLDARRL